MRYYFHMLVVTAMLVLANGCGRAPEGPPQAVVTVSSTPPGATVLVDGEVVGETPLESRQLSAGKHMLELRLPDHETVWEPLDLAPESRQELAFNLRQESAAVYLTSQPSGATVSLDGSDLGETPLTLAQVSVGEHTLELSLPSYATRTVKLQVDGPRPLSLSYDLESTLGTLRVSGLSAGSRLLLNDREYAQVPVGQQAVTLSDLAAATYQLEIRKPGHRSLNRQVVVRRNETTEVQIDPLVALPGEVRVVSEPAGATVTDLADGSILGQTPLTLENLPDGVLDLQIALPGYEAQTSRVAVSHGLFKEVEVSLQVNTGSLSLITAPPDVVVQVDGERAGITKPAANDEVSALFVLDNLPPGPHRLALLHPLYERYQRAFFIERGKTEHLGTIELKKIWRPTHMLKLKNGREFKGIVETRLADGSLVFERAPNIKVTYKADEIASVNRYTEQP